MAKKAILGGMGLSLREGLKKSMGIFLNELYKLEDSQEGLRALVEKRKPNWKTASPWSAAVLFILSREGHPLLRCQPYPESLRSDCKHSGTPNQSN